MSNPIHFSYDTVIPSAMLFNEKIEPSAIKLYAAIRGLTKTYGYCYATNAYLASAVKAGETTVKTWLSSLVKEGYLEIETNKNGIHWQRRIYISDKFKKSLRRSENGLPPAQKWATPSPKSGYILEEELKEEELKEETPPTPSKGESELLSFGRFVKMAKEEYEKLSLEHGSDVINDICEQINDHLASTGRKPYKDYPATIRNWLRRRQNDPKIASKPKDGQIQRDEQLAHRIAKEAINSVNGRDIHVGPRYIEFAFGPTRVILVKFGDHGFLEQCKTNLLKMGIYLDIF